MFRLFFKLFLFQKAQKQTVSGLLIYFVDCAYACLNLSFASLTLAAEFFQSASQVFLSSDGLSFTRAVTSKKFITQEIYVSVNVAI